MRTLVFLASLGLLADPLQAQYTAPLHNFEFGAAGVVPLNGYGTNGFNAGAGWRAGYQLRLLKHLGGEAGFTEAWPIAIDTCLTATFTCFSSRQYLKLLDYGLRGVVPLAGGRVELSLGVGGGYVWNQWKTYNNCALVQYSGKAAFALDRKGRVRVGFTLRLWRDLGRPTQQWISATGSVIVGLGSRP
jgi:hypothetical protein